VCAVITWENSALGTPNRVTVLFRDAPAKRQHCRLGRDSSDAIETRYWLNGPGIENPGRGEIFRPVKTDTGDHPDSYTMGTGSFSWIKRPRRDVDHPPHIVPRLRKE
jgi:hypothetical protein